MATIEEYRGYGQEIEDLLRLDSFPIAVKMIRTEAEIPAEAVRPKRDRRQHLAQCQAFSLSRRDGETVAMLKEDHWKDRKDQLPYSSGRRYSLPPSLFR